MRSSWPTRPTGSATVTPQPDGSGFVGGVPVELTGALLREGASRLAEAGSETARLDAELLLGHAVGVERTVVLAHPEAPVGADAVRRYRVLRVGADSLDLAYADGRGRQTIRLSGQ